MKIDDFIVARNLFDRLSMLKEFKKEFKDFLQSSEDEEDETSSTFLSRTTIYNTGVKLRIPSQFEDDIFNSIKDSVDHELGLVVQQLEDL